MGSSNDIGLPQDASRRFHTTRWSIVTDAASGETESSRVALEKLCQAYWFPIYAFARRQGNSAQDSADLTQGFFLHLLSCGALDAADPSRGRFRTFLLASFRNYCINDHRDASAKKRGGDVSIVSFDVDDGESKYGSHPSDDATAEAQFEREWALTLIDRVYDRLEAEFSEAGRKNLYDAVRHRLAGAPGEETYTEIAERLGMMPTALKVAVHRMRARFRELVRDEVRQTIGDSDDVDDELLRLFSTFQSS